MKKRISLTTSRTAQMTCLSRACSAFEKDRYYKSEDYIAPLILPRGLKSLIRISLFRRLFSSIIAPKGIYEYVIARTRYIDEVFKRVLGKGSDQVLILGAGFDTRALRFRDRLGNTRVFEIDAPLTQQAKIGQYQNRHLSIPPNLTFISLDFDKESLTVKLNEAGFRSHRRSLFILEGLTMYLLPESVDVTFKTIRDHAGKDSLIVFDYIYKSILRKESNQYGEKGILKAVTNAGEEWHFGIEKGWIDRFLEEYSMSLIDQKDAKDLEREYFSDPGGKIMGKVNATHCIVTAEKV